MISRKEMLLQALMDGGAGYGLDLIERVMQNTGGRAKLSVGTVYPALHELEKKGWVESCGGEGSKGRRRKYYRLTDEGRRVAGENRRAVLSLFRGVAAESVAGR